jgi:hypothetical protein
MGTGGQRRQGRDDDTEHPGAGRPEPETPPTRDLSKNVAGVGVTHEAARRRQRGGADAARSWDVGAKGEHQFGDVLHRLTARSWWDTVRGRNPRWRVLHSVHIADTHGAPLGDIDHVLLGPPGVITINTKYHRRGTVEVGGNLVIVNGRRTSYMATARREADRARAMLTAALITSGHTALAGNLPVRSLIVVVGAVPRITGEPAVPVIALQRLRYTVETLPPRLSSDEVTTLYETASSADTWVLPAPTGETSGANRRLR